MSWAHYLLQVNLYLVVFYCFYKLLLDKETYFILNRIYLVGSGLLSVTIPFLRFEWLTQQTVARQVYTGVDQLSGLVAQVGIIGGNEEQFDWGSLIVAIYVCGILFFIFRFIYQLVALKRLLYQMGSGVAFSFFNKKVISTDVPEPEIIDLHEEVHIRQKHTIDVLFFEILGIFTWFNPIIYAYKYTIKNIHEYLADEAAANFQGDKEIYSLLLLSQAFGTKPSTLTNGFFSKSLIKKRIYMLHKQRSKKTAILKYGLFVPLFALTLVLSSSTIRKNDKLIAVSEKIPLDNIQQAVATTIEAPLRIVEVNLAPIPEPILVKDEQKSKKIKISSDWDSFYRYLASHISYPKDAVGHQMQGNVRVNFDVEAGKINNVAIVGQLAQQTEAGLKQSVMAFQKELPAEDGNYSFVTAFKTNQLSSKEEAIANEAPSGYNELPKLTISNVTIINVPKEEIVDENMVYDHVNMINPPSYPGGIKKLYQFLAQTIRYPARASENNVQGTLFVSFTVERDGVLNDVKIEGRKLGFGLEEEALRVVKMSKRWIPGIQNGRTVRVKYNIPIRFTMPQNEVARLKTSTHAPATIDRKPAIQLTGSKSQQAKTMFIVDGKKIDQPSFASLDPKEIESLSVVKDANALILYGPEAANGAIVITTKTNLNAQ